MFHGEGGEFSRNDSKCYTIGFGTEYKKALIRPIFSSK